MSEYSGIPLGNGIKAEKDLYHPFMYGKTDECPKPIYGEKEIPEFYNYVNPKYKK